MKKRLKRNKILEAKKLKYQFRIQTKISEYYEKFTYSKKRIPIEKIIHKLAMEICDIKLEDDQDEASIPSK